MSRSPVERMADWRWWGDQALHMGASWPAFFVPVWLGWLVGLWIGAQREYVEIRKGGRPADLGQWFDLSADLAFSAIGGCLWSIRNL